MTKKRRSIQEILKLLHREVEEVAVWADRSGECLAAAAIHRTEMVFLGECGGDYEATGNSIEDALAKLLARVEAKQTAEDGFNFVTDARRP
jgi:hypothetical protein